MSFCHPRALEIQAVCPAADSFLCCSRVIMTDRDVQLLPVLPILKARERATPSR